MVFSFDPVQRFMAMFIGFSCVQAMTFVFYPDALDSILHKYLNTNIVQTVDKAPYPFVRAVGILECGLMLMYTGALLANDRYFVAVTVFGRSFAVFYAYGEVQNYGASPALYLFVVMDFLLNAFLTLTYFFMKETKYQRKLAPGRAWFAEAIVRVTILWNAYEEFVSGWNMNQNSGVGDVFSAEMKPFTFACRNLGALYMILAFYQIALAFNRVPVSVYYAIGLYHLIMAFLMDQSASPLGFEITKYYAKQTRHFEDGLAICMASVILSFVIDGTEHLDRKLKTI